VDDIATSAAGAALAQGNVHLAHTIGLSTVAEGIETADQCGPLLTSGCEHAQGYHFAKPLTAAECGARLGLVPAAGGGSGPGDEAAEGGREPRLAPAGEQLPAQDLAP
jgi:predicted signal transduction protein with EAL and GGDEF domain